MKFSKRLAPSLSISALIFLIGSITLATNLFLASRLPSATPPNWTTPSEFSRTESDNDLLHIVTTRFMQRQPNLLALGNARLLLFETFCLPSMINQNVDNFLWVVMTDPDLDHTLLARLKSLLSHHDNFYLVLSNEKLVTPENITMDATSESIITGDIEKLYSKLLDLSRPLLLETRLDADDALHRKTLYEIQQKARTLQNDLEGWQIICNKLHYEWRNDDIQAPNQTVETPGKLRLVMEGICVTPGYTLVKHREARSIEFPPWPRIGHHLITREWPNCLSDKTNATTNCWTKLETYPAAFRSRTITSAGMNRIESSANESIYDNQTTILWNFVEKDYGILPQKSLDTSRYLQKHLASIIADNLKGQCTHGHSCKQSSKEKLVSLLNASINYRDSK